MFQYTYSCSRRCNGFNTREKERFFIYQLDSGGYSPPVSMLLIEVGSNCEDCRLPQLESVLDRNVVIDELMMGIIRW
jgi:hypothetical protein